MKVSVVVEQKYSVFKVVNGLPKAEAKVFKKGEVLEAPSSYCRFLIEQGYVVPFEEQSVKKQVAKPKEKIKPKKAKPVILTEGARRAFEASELNEEELQNIRGTGKDGKIVARDVIEYVKGLK